MRLELHHARLPLALDVFSTMDSRRGRYKGVGLIVRFVSALRFLSFHFHLLFLKGIRHCWKVFSHFVQGAKKQMEVVFPMGIPMEFDTRGFPSTNGLRNPLNRMRGAHGTNAGGGGVNTTCMRPLLTSFWSADHFAKQVLLLPVFIIIINKNKRHILLLINPTPARGFS